MAATTVALMVAGIAANCQCGSLTTPLTHPLRVEGRAAINLGRLELFRTCPTESAAARVRAPKAKRMDLSLALRMPMESR